MKKTLRSAQQSLIKTRKIIRTYNIAGKIRTVVVKNSVNKVIEAMKDYTGRMLEEVKLTLNKSNGDTATTIELVDSLIDYNNSQQWQE